MFKFSPKQIVRTISGPGTTNVGDTLVDSDGGHWRILDEAEASYHRNSSSTLPTRVGAIQNGKIYT